MSPVAVALTAVAALCGCSVPREADLASSSSTAGSPGASSPGDSATTGSREPSASASPVPGTTSATSEAPTPSASPTPSPSPRPVTPPVPAGVKGYALTVAPKAVRNPLGDVKGAGAVFGASTIRSVSKGDAPVGLLFLYAVRPEYVGDKGVTSTLVQRTAKSIVAGGVPVKGQRYGKQSVSVASSAKSGTIVLWYADGVLRVVVGADAALVTGYAQAYVAAR